MHFATAGKLERSKPVACAGRDAEMAQLIDAYRRLARPDGDPRECVSLIFLEGPAGVGKARILAELRGRIRLEGGVVLEGRCEPGRAFGPFADIVDGALRFLDEVGAVPTGDLGGLSCGGGCHRLWHQHRSPDADPVANAELHGASPEIAAFEKRLRFFDAMEQLLGDVARVLPPVMLVHHLERADRGTLELLSFLLEAAQDAATFSVPNPLRMMVVASLRDDVGAAYPDAVDALRGQKGFRRLKVGALDVQGVRALLASEETVARVIERTGGKPELIELLLEADPLTPRARIERRLSQITPLGQELLAALAVYGRPAAVETLAAVAGVTVDSAVRSDFAQLDLLTRSVVENEVRFAFARETDRESCYALLAEPRRKALHARCVDVCVSRLDFQEAVRHAIATGDFARVSDLAIAAAASLAARHAHAEAASLLESLLEATGGHVPLVIREELADLYRIAGHYGQALVHARTVRDARPDDPTAARRVGYLLTVSGELEAAREPLETARRLAFERGSLAEVAEVEAQLAELEYQRGAYAAARDWAERALERARSVGALRTEIHARNTLGKLALAQKDLAAAMELFEMNRAMAAAEGLGHQEAQAHTNLGVALLLRRDLAAAEQACKRAIEVACRASDTRDRAIATENLAVIAHLARDYRRALGHYQEAIGLLKRLGNKAMLSRLANNLGELYLSLGDRVRARMFSDLAEHVSGHGGGPVRTAQRLRLRGRVEAAEGRPSQARAHFEEALSVFRSLGDARAAEEIELELAKLALSEGDVSQARALLRSLSGADDSPQRAAEVALVAADLERAAGGQAVAAARRAAELAERSGDDELLLAALIRWARALGDAGELAHAARVLERAQQVEHELTQHVPEEALACWAERPVRVELLQVQAQLLSAGAAHPPEVARRERVESLTPLRTPSQRPKSGALDRAPSRDPRCETWRKRYPNIVGSSPAIKSVFAVLDRVAGSEATVLVRGESGTGKELVAEAIHRNSPRAGKPLVKVHCAALVETLLLSELFGHEKGAFTGAQSRKKGRFELADGGTIFLDEIGDISPKTQVALLRVLQEREFERVGGTQPIRVDVRIIAATHRDLEKMVREGTFREDLYYRLRGVTIEMPSLRKRLEDLPELCAYLLERIAAERKEPVKRISPAALERLAAHRWPGNVRELENVLRSATLFADGDELGPGDFEAFADTFQALEPEIGAPSRVEVRTSRAETGHSPSHPPIEALVYEKVRAGGATLFEMKKMLERECIVRALEETQGNITRAAALLGMKRPRLSQLVKEYGLSEVGK